MGGKGRVVESQEFNECRFNLKDFYSLSEFVAVDHAGGCRIVRGVIDG
jgi:hypothetical protein